MFRFTRSVLLRGGKGAAGRYRCVWVVLTMFCPHWVCPTHRCVLSPSTLLRLPAALYGAGPALCAVPALGYSTKTWTWLRLRFVPSLPEDLVAPAFCAFPAQAAQAARSLTHALSPGAVRLLSSAAPASVSTCAGGVCAPCV